MYLEEQESLGFRDALPRFTGVFFSKYKNFFSSKAWCKYRSWFKNLNNFLTNAKFAKKNPSIFTYDEIEKYKVCLCLNKKFNVYYSCLKEWEKLDLIIKKNFKKPYVLNYPNMTYNCAIKKLNAKMNKYKYTTEVEIDNIKLYSYTNRWAKT